MTFKVYFQPDNTKRPVRENTQSIYIEADSEAEALLMVEHHTDYNIEYVEQLDEKALVVRQNRGKHNCARTEDVQAFEDAWMAWLKGKHQKKIKKKKGAQAA